MRKIILPANDCLFVMRVEKEEDCVFRICDEIRMNKEALRVASSTLVSRKNPGSQFLSEITL